MRLSEIIDPPDGRKPVTLDDAERALREAYPTIALPPFEQWVTLENSQAWFSAFHDGRNAAFDLPFYPPDFIYSPIVMIPVRQGSGGGAHYKRGVKKYLSMIKRGEPLPPITIVCDYRSGGRWYRMDGNHRWDAAVLSGAASIPAVFALPEKLLK